MLMCGPIIPPSSSDPPGSTDPPSSPSRGLGRPLLPERLGAKKFAKYRAGGRKFGSVSGPGADFEDNENNYKLRRKICQVVWNVEKNRIRQEKQRVVKKAGKTETGEN